MLYLERQYTECQARCKQLLEQTNLIPVSPHIMKQSLLDSNPLSLPIVEQEACLKRKTPYLLIPLLILYQLHPIHITYLCTYAAICLEFTARSLHPLSTTKIPLLLSAREYYLRAITSLFTMNSSCSSSSFSSSSSPSSRPLSSILSFSLVEAQPSSSSCSSAPSSSSYSSSDFRQDITYEEAEIEAEAEDEDEGEDEDENEDEDDTIRISPLRIRKATSPNLNEHEHAPPTTANNPKDPNSPFVSSSLFLSSTFKYHLTTLQPLLQSHLSSLNTMISATHLDQENRQIRLRLQHTAVIDGGGGGGQEEMRMTEKRDRIHRLRKRGWIRERFEPERYRVLAGAALAEL